MTTLVAAVVVLLLAVIAGLLSVHLRESVSLGVAIAFGIVGGVLLAMGWQQTRPWGPKDHAMFKDLARRERRTREGFTQKIKTIAKRPEPPR